MSLSFPTAAILSAMCAAPIYGMNCILAVFCANALSNTRRFGKSWPLAIVLLTQWILCTGNFLSLFLQLIRGFVHPPHPSTSGTPTQPNLSVASTAYFENQSSTEHFVEFIFVVFTSLMAAFFMTWRVYVVYDRKAWLSVPFLLLNIVALVFGTLMVQAETLVRRDPSLFFENPELQRTTTMWATSVITQTAGTLLIMYRELSTPKSVPNSKTSRQCTLTAIAYTIIDSGATYTLLVIVTLALYVSKRSEGAVVGAILGQISATVPLTIILREWWEAAQTTSLQDPFLPRTALLRESHEMLHGGALRLDTEQTRENDGVNVCVVKATHMDAQSLLASEEARKSVQLGHYSDI
ncbi:unnamed protein product [Peniophora sp. CBMAI 1063]|nr:unnamed protein product [Peniophora sp. CBMAI 1063]